MNLAFDGFDWDRGNRAKCGKHGVSADEIEAMFRAEPLVAPDPRHSDQETRFIAVGRNAEGRPMFVAFTFRTRGGAWRVRPVSARYMREKEIRAYEAARS
jgi:uncharacterized DUF497 family protein